MVNLGNAENFFGDEWGNSTLEESLETIKQYLVDKIKGLS